MGDRLRKVKRDFEVGNLGQYSFIPTTLTRKYCTYLILQRLRSLSCKFYTDTLFAKNNSIIGNICAQLFIDRESLFYVRPMKYKSQAGEALNIVTRDIGVPNTLISDNAGEQMVLHTELQECICRCFIDDMTT